jgi:hypothetical protein
MKRIAIAAVLLLSSASLGVALAESDPSADQSSPAGPDQRSRPSWGDREGGGPRFAEGFFDRFRDGDGEHHRHRHHWDDDDDDDDGSASADRGGQNRPADPNSAKTPVPDSGVFNGKARPKVEVR